MSSIIRGSDDFDTRGGNAVKAWVNFNGTGTPAIRAGFNVSSITDNGPGDYTVNFTSAMPDVNYAPIFGAAPAIGISTSVGSWHGGVALDGSGVPLTKTASAVRIKTAAQAGPGTITDCAEVYLSILR